MRNTSSWLFLHLLTGFLLCISIPVRADYDKEDVLRQTIHFPAVKGTIYELLEEVSRRTGLLFIYDSRVLDNEKFTSVQENTYTLENVIYQITGNRQLKLRVLGNHILIQAAMEEPENMSLPNAPPPKENLIVEGALNDLYNQEPIPFATVGLLGTSVGTITNQTGEFRILIPDSLEGIPLIFSHVGYEPKQLLYEEFPSKHITFTLEPKVIPIQEIVVRSVHPQRLLREMLDKRKDNYSSQPVYLTSFYREGVEKKKGIVNLTEAVFKVYKSPFDAMMNDQVKMLKMRKITNQHEKDTLMAKIKSGIQASLLLDLIKNLPDFLTLEEDYNPYNYIHSDITIIDNRLANVISFEQKPEVKEPLYKGDLFIDNENDALLMVRFQINPEQINKATPMLIEKRSKGLKINTHEVTYTVSYKEWNGKYYVNHIRGDLYFRVKTRKQLFSTPVHMWFEMVTCNIDTENVTRFTRSQTLPKTAVFSDVKFMYDADFWGNFNIILPEEKLNETISKITAKIEESEQ